MLCVTKPMKVWHLSPRGNKECLPSILLTSFLSISQYFKDDPSLMGISSSIIFLADKIIIRKEIITIIVLIITKCFF